MLEEWQGLTALTAALFTFGIPIAIFLFIVGRQEKKMQASNTDEH